MVSVEFGGFRFGFCFMHAIGFSFVDLLVVAVVWLWYVVILFVGYVELLLCLTCVFGLAMGLGGLWFGFG